MSSALHSPDGYSYVTDTTLLLRILFGQRVVLAKQSTV